MNALFCRLLLLGITLVVGQFLGAPLLAKPGDGKPASDKEAPCLENCLQEPTEDDGGVPGGESGLNVLPSAPATTTTRHSGIDWNRIGIEAFGFLTFEQGFRYVTEAGTRHSHTRFFQGYADSLNGLHGWADGDPFLVNYVGHPMQGAVTGYIFLQNDPKSFTAEFGKNRRYWKSRLMATAFSWLYSEQFEIGPFSEASLGHTQAFFPQQGFVDHVITPTIGLAWMIAEDALDKYLIKRVERRTQNPFVRLLVRGTLNPSRSMANATALQPPWHRTDRMDPWEPPRESLSLVNRERFERQEPPHSTVTTFEFMPTARSELYVGSGSHGACIGGGGTAAYRVGADWQLIGDVAGCKMTHFGEYWSGDSLTYMIGPRWTRRPLRQWTPYAQLLIGGRTLTHELMNPVEKAQLQLKASQNGTQLDFPDHALYTHQSGVTGLAVSASGGLDVKLSSAIALRVADFGYMHSWHSSLDGIAYSHALQFSGGLILRFGTW